ncbi:FG-GAP-like repeat-containing protein [Streptomyces sp. NPDC008222]|uniref:trypsin-like serine peptidase n=1 Tax=Streptomyces sp. NPDC008222 TaxID=3364820 RepID=UPI0036E24E0A
MYKRRIFGAVGVLCTPVLLGSAAPAQGATPVPATTSPAPATSADSHEATSVPSASKPVTASPSADGSWTVQDAIRFWTPQRMASATDPSGRVPQPSGWMAPRRNGLTSAGLTGQHFDGITSVGMLFHTDSNMRAHYCSAGVVRSAGHDLILTAGHCLGKNAVFVPKYDHTKPAAQQPYGIWPVKEWFRDTRYASDKSANSDLDFAFAALGPNGGREIEDVVGGNTLAPTPGFANKVTVVGYPSIGHNPQDQAFRCSDVRTTALTSYYQMQIDCGGMWGGVSGGPWFSQFDASGNTGQIIGNVGGFNGGGPDVKPSDPLYNRITYSPLHGDRFFQLYADAQKGLHTDYGPYQQPPLPYTMGNGTTWKHAKLMASGDFNGVGHSDLIVVWDDGEVTLYTSDGNGHFVAERQMLKRNPTWKGAATITAGDFTGSNRFDLMVRWSDGKVTLYGDVGSNGLKVPGTQMVGPNGTWKKAAQIAAGRFGASQYVTDLVVRWSDGGVSLYTNVSAGRFGQEHKLSVPSGTWKDATLLTSGEFSGNQKWDLMVQRPDGELDNYVGTTASGLGTKVRIKNPHGLWTHGTVVTAGNYTGDHRTDDLVVRSSDGGTTTYTDTGKDHLGTGQVLVPHA